MSFFQNRYRIILLALVLLLVSSSLALAACAPKQTTEEEPPGTASADTDTAEEQPVMELPAWKPDSDCATCHTVEAKSGSDATTSYSYHADLNTIGCITCHDDTEGVLTGVHDDYATASLPKKLKNTNVVETVCLSCHNKDELIVRTESSEKLTDSKGTVVNPHQIPASDSHDTTINCSSCHKMHSTKPLANTAQTACAGCHHAGVYECNTCH